MLTSEWKFRNVLRERLCLYFHRKWKAVDSFKIKKIIWLFDRGEVLSILHANIKEETQEEEEKEEEEEDNNNKTATITTIKTKTKHPHENKKKIKTGDGIIESSTWEQLRD